MEPMLLARDTTLPLRAQSPSSAAGRWAAGEGRGAASGPPPPSLPPPPRVPGSPGLGLAAAPSPGGTYPSPGRCHRRRCPPWGGGEKAEVSATGHNGTRPGPTGPNRDPTGLNGDPTEPNRAQPGPNRDLTGTQPDPNRAQMRPNRDEKGLTGTNRAEPGPTGTQPG